MKRFRSNLLTIPLLAVVIATCATAALAQYPASNNRTVMGRLDMLERNIQMLQRQGAGGGELPEGVEPSDAAAGSLQSQIAELQETISKLRGEVEQAQFQNRQIKDQFDRTVKDMTFRIEELEKKSASVATIAPAQVPATAVPAPAENPPEAIDTSSETTDANPDENGTQTPPAQSTVKSLNRPDKKPPGAEFASSREHYNHAFRQLNAAQYAEAGSSFQSFVKQYPKDPLAGNAYYWLGETFYVRRDYVKAADSFRQGFEALPAGPKAADNLLKLSMSLNAMKRDKEACVVLKQLVSKFGKNSPATKEKAQGEISRIGCE